MQHNKRNIVRRRSHPEQPINCIKQQKESGPYPEDRVRQDMQSQRMRLGDIWIIVFEQRLPQRRKIGDDGKQRQRE